MNEIFRQFLVLQKIVVGPGLEGFKNFRILLVVDAKC